MTRVIIAGVAGGIAAFVAGAVEHTMFGWSERTFLRLKDEQAVREFVGQQLREPGMYVVPALKEGFERLSPEEQRQDEQRVREEFEKGPSACIILAPAGEDMMGPKQLGGEALANIAAALLVAWVVSQTQLAELLRRWSVCLAIGVTGWLSISASHYLWYRFPATFERDELLCVLFEWTVAGLVIAAIVKPQGSPSGRPANA